MKAESPALGPLGQVRIYKGAQHRFIWPVHLAGWLELGWTTEPTVTSAPRKKRVSSTPSPIEVNPTNESPIGASPVGVGSATADEPLPVLVTDFLVDPSVPTND